mmetsp:Transcript_29662/g.71379  ORF Transcript_29662/g.71379 Transcript_29662/m.71379 type:complete len:276 (+) Transcript_29662:1081-1908(+)
MVRPHYLPSHQLCLLLHHRPPYHHLSILFGPLLQSCSRPRNHHRHLLPSSWLVLILCSISFPCSTFHSNAFLVFRSSQLLSYSLDHLPRLTHRHRHFEELDTKCTVRRFPFRLGTFSVLSVERPRTYRQHHHLRYQKHLQDHHLFDVDETILRLSSCSLSLAGRRLPQEGNPLLRQQSLPFRSNRRNHPSFDQRQDPQEIRHLPIPSFHFLSPQHLHHCPHHHRYLHLRHRPYRPWRDPFFLGSVWSQSRHCLLPRRFGDCFHPLIHYSRHLHFR